MDSKALAVVQPPAAAIDPYQPGNFEAAWQLAQIVAKSRLAPNIQTPEQALVVLATGHELGLSSMQSLRGIHVIEGRPSPSADTLVAVVLRSGLAAFFREVETTDTSSTWETQRRGDNAVRRGTFTMDEARAAGLIKDKGNWAKYPRRMLAARAKAFLARDVYPDLVLGLYTPEEQTQGQEHVDAQTPPPRVVQIVEQPTEQTPSLFERINGAETLDALQALARECADVPPGQARDSLRAAYSKRKAELTPQVVEQPRMREPGEEG